MTLPKMKKTALTRTDVAERLAVIKPQTPADFMRLWLNGLDLPDLDFCRAILRATALNGVNLSIANLDRAVLSQARMIGANLSKASRVGAELFQTQLGSSDLSGADFTGASAAADFSRAKMGPNLSGLTSRLTWVTNRWG